MAALTALIEHLPAILFALASLVQAWRARVRVEDLQQHVAALDEGVRKDLGEIRRSHEQLAGALRQAAPQAHRPHVDRPGGGGD